MKCRYPVKTCPWCGVTPKFRMNCNDNETWLPRVICENFHCKVSPKTSYVPIRRKQKENIDIIKEKVERVIKFWNDGNLGFINEGFELDYERIVEDYKSGKIGLPGYRQEK